MTSVVGTSSTPDTSRHATGAALPGSVLQRLVDAAPAGAVVLPAGEYVLQDSLRLRSGIHLQGHRKVRLRRAPTVETPLTQITGYGHRELIVADAAAFPPGTGIAITDSRGGGFGTLVATVIARDENTLFIDRPVEHDLRPANNVRIRNLFPVVAGYGVEHAGVEGIIIEGDASPAPLDGCRDGGVYLIGCRDVHLRNVEVARYAGDGISFQQCIDTCIDQCHIHHNAGHGLHPGSGSVRYVMRNNRLESNSGCGIFYCLRTSHSLCVDNSITSNAAEGISIGERDTDHVIRGNTVRDNAAAGILFRPPVHIGGDRVVVIGNRLQNNASKSGGAQIVIASGTNDVVIRHNQVTGDPGSPLIEVGTNCRGVCVESNEDASGGAIDPRIDAKSPIAGNSVFAAGPEAIPTDGARHLGVAVLGRWVDRTQTEQRGPT